MCIHLRGLHGWVTRTVFELLPMTSVAGETAAHGTYHSQGLLVKTRTAPEYKNLCVLYFKVR